MANLRYRNVGLIAKQGGDEVTRTLAATRDHLLAAGISVLPDPTATAGLGADDEYPLQHIAEHCDLAIVVGGDGTLLSAARVLAGHDVPIVGVNLGRLGFLVDVPPRDQFAALNAILGGSHYEERRFLLMADVQRDGESRFQGNAFNDVILRIRERVRLIEFETYVDGEFVTLQRADGMIAASPTGSTAYALSGGGPILVPTLEAILLLPICSHTFSARPIVISADSTVELRLCDDNRDVSQLVCDGQDAALVEHGDRIVIRRAPHAITLLHPENYDFYGLLREKLNWS